MHIIKLSAEEIERRLKNLPDHWGQIAEDDFDPESIYAQSGIAVAQAIENTVKFAAQDLAVEQQTQARNNIGAASADELTRIDSKYDGELDVIKAQIADILYEPITISSFGHNAGTRERGETVTDVKLSWSISKTPTLLTLDSKAVDVASKEKTLSGLSITYNNVPTWTLVATDDRSATSTKTTTISFYSGIYYGVGTTENNFTSAFVTSLTKKLCGSKAYDFTVNPADQYIYYAVPKRYGTVKFKVGGFEGGFQTPETISVTNSAGYTEDYYVYRSTNKITGSTTVDVT